MRKIGFLILFLSILLSACAPTPVIEAKPVNVFFAGEPGGVKTALDLAVQAGTMTLVSDLTQADVLVLDGEIPDPSAIAERVQAGAGLVLALGENTSQADVQTVLGEAVTLTQEDEALSLVGAVEGSDPLWRKLCGTAHRRCGSAHASREWTCGQKDLVRGYEDNQGILWKGISIPDSSAEDRVFVLTPWLAGGANPQIQEWGYFNYFIYHLVERAAGAEPLSFSAYPASPVPHAKDRSALLIFLAAELALILRRLHLGKALQPGASGSAG